MGEADREGGSSKERGGSRGRERQVMMPNPITSGTRGNVKSV